MNRISCKYIFQCIVCGIYPIRKAQETNLKLSIYDTIVKNRRGDNKNSIEKRWGAHLKYTLTKVHGKKLSVKSYPAGFLETLPIERGHYQIV